MSVSFIMFDKWKNKCFFLPLEMRHSTEANRISQMSIITSISQSRLKGMENPGNRLLIVHFQGIKDFRNIFFCSNFIHQNRFIIPITTLITIIYFKIMPYKITWLFLLTDFQFPTYWYFAALFIPNWLCWFIHYFHHILIIQINVKRNVLLPFWHSAIIWNGVEQILILRWIYYWSCLPLTILKTILNSLIFRLPIFFSIAISSLIPLLGNLQSTLYTPLISNTWNCHTGKSNNPSLWIIWHLYFHIFCLI